MPTPLPTSFYLTTPRLRLRIPHAKDIPRVFSATRHAGFNDGMQWEPPTAIEELRAPHERGVLAWKNGEAYGFTVAGKTTDELLGRISIRPTEEKEVWNVGFWTHPEVQGQGIMSEALTAVLDFGFTQLRATRIEAAYATWNTASEKVLRRAGFHFVQRVEEGLFKHGAWVPENVVSISRSEWRKD
ncbi:GNAT family N-acetyltransferase [Lewinella sp. W8]|uniref:GNAT family N-acetyltransferase n=1 Tax=Lewinella sp. W8 TaxID=2528208 RepID=UPI0010679151|nr:GNAT family protein [Lewinella sp. W8]MTB51962.1 GNAT family N-acetyltransferase [Lewinella sp. W8]